MNDSSTSPHISPTAGDAVLPESTLAEYEEFANWWEEPERTLRQKEPRDAFPSPFDFRQREPITLIELRMNYYSGKIRSKPSWWDKIHDTSIVARWRTEVVEHDQTVVDKLWGGEERVEHRNGTKKWPRDPITTAQLDYIFDELRYAASERDSETGLFATAIYGVHESRSLIPVELKSELLKGVSLLECVPDEEKDWHPGSNKQVLDLVHPSLYCLRINGSQVRTSGVTDGQRYELLTHEAYMARRPDLQFVANWKEWVVSDEYQWLPTDFQVSALGEVKPLGYINNLHPRQHGTLYPTITSIVARFVPLFQRALADSLSADPELAVQPDPYMWYSHLDEPDLDDWEQQRAWSRVHKWPKLPDTRPFAPQPAAERVQYSLKGRKIQVIVKLANIILTPENPKYDGGAWHVEGMANENIVGTGLYYYACENITESRLAFRTTTGSNGVLNMLPYEQSDLKGYWVAYGFGGEDALNQVLGHVVAEEDKCIAFPNVYQHRVDAFELADPSKPGHRKILCFFLVNPDTEIMSTTDVLPQQQDWVMEDVEKGLAMGRLPAELNNIIADYTREGTITRGEAEGHRARLMKERSQFVVHQNEHVYEVPFNMCEH